MDKPIDLQVVRNERKEPCPYCGEAEHKTPLMCPRIAYITAYSDNECVDIHFWGESDGPDVAA